MKRIHLLIAVAALLVAAAIWLPDETGDLVAVAARDAGLAVPAQEGPALGRHQTAANQDVSGAPEVQRIRSRIAEEASDAGIFAVQSWLSPQSAAPPPPPPTPAQPRAQVTPRAPAMPFAVVGRYEEAGSSVYFLTLNNDALVARVGETLAQDWHVKAADATALTLEHRPTRQAHRIAWSAKR